MLESTQTSRVAGAAAGAGAAVAVVAAVAHGFGRDDETMYGATHIAVGHLLPAVAAALTTVWLTALAVPKLRRLRDLLWLGIAQIGLALWAAATAVDAAGLYVLARTDPAGAIHHAQLPLVAGFFATATVTMVVGLVGCLVIAARRGDVAVWAVPLLVLGTLGAFVAGPVGDILLAVGLGGSGLRALRSAPVVPRPAVAGA